MESDGKAFEEGRKVVYGLRFLALVVDVDAVKVIILHQLCDEVLVRLPLFRICHQGVDCVAVEPRNRRDDFRSRITDGGEIAGHETLIHSDRISQSAVRIHLVRKWAHLVEFFKIDGNVESAFL